MNSWHGEVVDDGFKCVVGMEWGKEVGEEGDMRMSYLNTVAYTYTSMTAFYFPEKLSSKFEEEFEALKLMGMYQVGIRRIGSGAPEGENKSSGEKQTKRN